MEKMVRFFLGCLILFLGSLPCGTAFSADLPRFDVNAHCSDIANFGGTYSAQIEQSCFEMGQGSYNVIKRDWAMFPDTMQNHCVEIARFGGHGSYQILESCIEMETAAGSTPKEFKY